MIRFSFLVIVLLALCNPAVAQDAPGALVQCGGEATIFAAPSYADFVFEASFEGAAFEQGMTAALAFGGKLREALNTRDLPLVSVEAAPPAIPDVPDNLVVASATARIGLVGLGSGDSADIEFARICDAVAMVAANLECGVAGPIIVPGDRDALIRSAVSQATENAYPACDALAITLKTTVYAVDAVRVESITWNAPGENAAFRPSIRKISCTASVAVSYSVTTR